MIRNALIILASFLLCSCSHQVRTYDRLSAVEKSALAIEEPSRDFKIGEKLVYAVDWVGIPAGYISLEVKGLTTLNNTSTYHLVAKALPNKFFKIFYNVEYTVNSYIDTKLIRPVKFSKERLMDGRKTLETIDFDYLNNLITWHYSEPKMTSRFPLGGQTQDLLSALYYFRTRNIKPSEVYRITLIYNNKSWVIKIIPVEIKDIEIEATGVFKTLILDISSSLNDHITGFNNIQIYLSLDKRRLPILFKMRTKIGSLSGVLVSKN